MEESTTAARKLAMEQAWEARLEACRNAAAIVAVLREVAEQYEKDSAHYDSSLSYVLTIITLIERLGEWTTRDDVAHGVQLMHMDIIYAALSKSENALARRVGASFAFVVGMAMLTLPPDTSSTYCAACNALEGSDRCARHEDPNY